MDSEILAGAKGIFDVEYPTGNLIFSKFKEFRFPNEEEIIEKINSIS
ncbi:MAG: Rdx family protein [Candidatus Sericytochromatia bacterium]